MTGTEDRGAQGDTNLPSVPAAGFLGEAAIVALLAIVASLLPGASAAQAQTPGSTRLELATVADGTAYHKWSDDDGASWSSWTRLDYANGTLIAGTPAVVSDGPGRLNVFALALSDPSDPSSYNGLWQNVSIDGNWSGWTRVPAGPYTSHTPPQDICDDYYGCFFPVSGPSVSSWGPGRMDLVVIGYSAQWGTALLHSWADNYSWSGTWEALTIYPMKGAPGVVSWGPGRLDVFMTSSIDSSLWHTWFDNDEWWTFENRGGPPNGGLTSPPTVSSPGSGALTLYTRGSDGYLWGIWFNGGWSNWYSIGCCLGGDASVLDSVAALSAPGETDVFVIGTLHDLYRKAYINAAQGWLDWQYLDQPTFTNIAATAWVPIAPAPGGGGGGPGPTCGPPTQIPCPLPK